MIQITSKLKQSEKSIFSIVSQLSKKHNAINLSQGFPDFDVSSDLKRIVTNVFQGNRDQYAPMPGISEIRQVLSKKYEKAYSLSINPESEITITAGATQGIFTILQAFIHPNDEVIIIEPAYDSYVPSIELAGGKAVPYSLDDDFKVNWKEFEQLISVNTKMIIINNPHNPTGQIFSSDDLLALSQIVKGTNILILSDEVYEHLVYDGHQHQSVLKFPELYKRSLAVYSFGKTFHATGWKLGYVIGPKNLMNEFRGVHQWNVFSVNSFLQYSLSEHLKDEESYLQLGAFYQRKRDLFLDGMKQSRFKPIPSSGSYFQLYDYSEISDLADLDFNQWLIKEHGVAAIPISPFCSKENASRKVVRFCFAKKDETLAKALNILTKI